MSFTRPNWQKELLEKRQDFETWAIFGQFAMAIARPYGKKMADLGGKLQSAKKGGHVELEIT